MRHRGRIRGAARGALLLLLPLAALAVSAPVAGASYHWTRVRAWGGKGTGNGQFTEPVGIAVSPGGYVYVSDGQGNRIEEFTSKGRWFRSFGRPGSGFSGFDRVGQIAISPYNGDVYAPDIGNDLIKDCGHTGPCGGAVAINHSCGDLADCVDQPVGVTGFDSEANYDGTKTAPGQFWVNAGNDMVWLEVDEFDSGNGQGLQPASWYTCGQSGGAPGEIGQPTGIATDPHSLGSTVWVSDFDNNRVSLFSGFESEHDYNLLGSFPCHVVVSFSVQEPGGIGLDSAGHVFVAEDKIGRIDEFDGHGHLLAYFGSGKPLAVAAYPGRPWDVFFTEKDVVQEYSLPPTARFTAVPAKVTGTATPTFKWTTDEPAGAKFGCRRYDSRLRPLAAWGVCSSGHRLRLADGTYTFAVRARNDAGLLGLPNNYAIYTFTVDTHPPSTTITGGPKNGSTTRDSTPTLSFKSSEAHSKFMCARDSGFSFPCNSPWTGHFGAGKHEFEVYAIDQAGNHDRTPARVTFTETG